LQRLFSFQQGITYRLELELQQVQQERRQLLELVLHQRERRLELLQVLELA
jgi:hypothetical protein